MFYGDESELSLDEQLERSYQRFKERVSGRLRDTVTECYAILDPATARQIEMAAQRAEFGAEYTEWAEKARINAGYGRLDQIQDSR